MNNTYIISYDIGTTACKTCLFTVSDTLQLVESAAAEYRISYLPNGGAEQDPEFWWNAMKQTTRDVLDSAEVLSSEIQAVSFCSQMQGLIVVDSRGNYLRPAMSYLDQRAEKELKEGISHGIQVDGMNLGKLLSSLIINGAVAGSVKDPLWKFKWIEKNEPLIFSRIHKWLDVKDYLILRCTGNFVMTRDSAFATFLYDSRKGHHCWSPRLCRIFGVSMEHLPKVIQATDIAGTLSAEAASELGLSEDTPVFGGGGDASLIGVGSGAICKGDTHIYTGTSGWVSTMVKNRIVDIDNRIAAIVGADPEMYIYFGEQETAGKCLEWVKDHLALDEIGLYLKKTKVTDDPDSVHRSLYDFLVESIDQSPPGSRGVMFTPWLHGNRSPFEDTAARGMFFNLQLNTGKRDMIRAVVEGIIFHQRWLLEASAKKVTVSDEIRFVGGGALSPGVCQIMADILGKTVTTIKNPQNAGAVGAAIIAALGLKIIQSFGHVKDYIPISGTYHPRKEHMDVYTRQFNVFKELYYSNRKNFRSLNR